MYLIQLLLPSYKNHDQAFPVHLDGGARDTLVARFGGLIAFTRVSPAGPCQEDGAHNERDETAKTRSRSWWAGYRDKQLARFEQAKLIACAWPVEMR